MDVRTKAKVIDMFKAGATTEQVAKKFPNVPLDSLRATKAHVTRGTHG